MSPGPLQPSNPTAPTVMRDRVSGLLHIVFHSMLPLLLVLILLVGNALLSDASGLMR